MTDPTARIPLSALPREIAPLIEGAPPSYRRFYFMVLDARIPGEQNEDGRWSVLRSDVPAIIQAAGLRLKASAAAPAKSRRTPATTIAAA